MHDTREWEEEDGRLRRTFTFADFRAALAFVNKVGDIAEQLGHHPDLCIRDYKKVIVSTTTHDQGNVVTERDRQLAAAIDALI